ncbi:MAG: nucleotidyltransferase substrate binding protein [Hydrogenovibrio sp.]|uniref:nucleotidyltransferase substrate binding protein n=1 Tax=Hydrogenovibrio sp. TaxID=2065821 RepID=UPI002870A306|nr:nucleotidyltransferase substrate binding protein [Hydrogenovibrio sp.]MDR9499717.1 nucleotidyltransferase substrate binding protein [Hydrogenovibrio sp.]
MTTKTDQDIRWIQRFANYKKALAQLTRFMQKPSLNEFEEQGLIQAFEYTHELAWKVQKDFLESQGVTELFGSKKVAREAFKTGLIENGDVWMQMIKSRNLTVHTYNEETTQAITQAIRSSYYAEFCWLEKRFEGLIDQQENA